MYLKLMNEKYYLIGDNYCRCDNQQSINIILYFLEYKL